MLILDPACQLEVDRGNRGDYNRLAEICCAYSRWASAR